MLAVIRLRPAILYAADGEPVPCFNCGKIIYHLNRDVDEDTACLGEIFDGEPAVRNGVPNPCPNCGAEWFPQWYERLRRFYYVPVRHTDHALRIKAMEIAHRQGLVP